MERLRRTKLSWNDLSERWKNYFIDILHTTAKMSKDENTKVGSLIIDTERKVVVSSSWNEFPGAMRSAPKHPVHEACRFLLLPDNSHQ